MRRLLLLCTSVFVLLCPASALAANVDIGEPTQGKLTHVWAGDLLECQARYKDDAEGIFYGADDGPASCGTSVAVDSTLFGYRGTPFTATTQSAATGDGSSSNPRTVVTRVAAGTTDIGVERTDSYVFGEEAYQSDIRIINGAATSKTVRIYQGGDCYLGDQDQGYGFSDAQTGAIACTKTPNNQPPGRVLGFLPLTSGSTRIEGQYSSDVNAAIESRQELPNTCKCEEQLDNGAAVSWTVTVAPGQSVTRSLLTFFSPVGTVPDQSPPAGLKIETPANGSATNASQPVFGGTGSAAPGDVRTAYLHVFKGTEVTGDPFAFQEIPIGDNGKWSAKLTAGTLPDGVYTAYFAQVDSSNNVGQSPAIAFAVDTKAPAPTVTAPAEGTTLGLRPLFSGVAGNTAGDAKAVTVFLRGPNGTETPIGDVKNDGGRWLHQPATDLAEGAYEIRVSQSDDAGNVGTSPTVRFTVAAGGAQFTGELPPAGTPATDRTPPAVTKTKSTKTKKRMPNIVGLRIDKARDALAKAGIHFDLAIDEVGGSSDRFKIGDVMQQSPARNATVVSDADHRRRIRVRVFQGTKTTKKACPTAAQLNKALKGMDLDVALRILKADGCKVELNMQTKGNGSAPEIGKVGDGRGSSVTVTVNVPRRPSGQDLFLLVRTNSTSEFKGLNVADWSLPLAQTKFDRLSVQVIDRAGRFVENATVRFDLSQVDFRGDASLSTGRNGEAANPANPGVTIKADREGIVKVLATATGRDGQTIYGYAQIRVKNPGTNNEWETINGLSFLNDTCRVGPRNSATAQGCVTNWLGSQTIPDELGRTTVSGIGPAVDPASESAFATLGGMLVDAISYDQPIVRMWQSNKLSAVNKMRNMVANAGYFPAQLVIQGGSPISGAIGRGVQQSSTINRLVGTQEQVGSGPQVLASSGNVLAGSKPGLYTISGGQGRVFDAAGGKATIDARNAKVHTFPDGTSILDDGRAETPWAAGRNGAIGLYP